MPLLVRSLIWHSLLVCCLLWWLVNFGMQSWRSQKLSKFRYDTYGIYPLRRSRGGGTIAEVEEVSTHRVWNVLGRRLFQLEFIPNPTSSTSTKSHQLVHNIWNASSDLVYINVILIWYFLRVSTLFSKTLLSPSAGCYESKTISTVLSYARSVENSRGTQSPSFPYPSKVANTRFP